jgi:Tol biopolymer transport system component
MNRLARAVAIGAVMRLPIAEPVSFDTVAQADVYRSPVDPASVAVSGDGRFVAFTSSAQLVPGDTNHQADVYVLDRSDGRVTLESLSPDGQVAQGDSEHPSISADGCLVAYSVLNKIMLRDRSRGDTKVLTGGREPVISADGRFVTFTSMAPDFLKEDVYLFDTQTGGVRRISLDNKGLRPPSGWSGMPSISGNGRLVAFVSTSPLVAGADKPTTRVYIRDLQANTTTLVAPGGRAAISADGRYVAFVSLAADLVPNDRNNSADIFLADLETGGIEIVSRSRKGGAANGASTNAAVSGDGRFVAFQSEASDMVCAGGCPQSLEDINLLWDVFLFDRQSRAMTRLSTDPLVAWMEASSGPAIDAAGSVVAFSSRHPIDVNDKAHDFDLFIRHPAGR